MRTPSVQARNGVARRSGTVMAAVKPATVKETTKGKTAGRATETTSSRSAARTLSGKSASSSGSNAGSSKGSQFYFNFTGFPFPLGPSLSRKTVRYEIEKDSVWIFEQTQALEVFNVYTPVRMTVIKLRSGGLWVHAPVAPTQECLRLIRELGAPVEYIVLPTFAYEHKVFVGPFSRAFPKAQVYTTPFQWSFPLNLPPQFFGIFPKGELRTADPDVPWADEIEQKLFLPPSIGVGDYVRFSECAFFHKRSRTLIVTDAVVYLTDQPPEVIPREALLDLARDGFLAQFIAGDLSREEVKQIANPRPAEDTAENRSKGWQRMALLVLYFGPGNLLQQRESFDAVSDRLFVGPVVETLVYSKIPQAVVDWVDEICREWNFSQIIPCHFTAPIKAGPADFRRAFAFAYQAVAERQAAEGGANGAGTGTAAVQAPAPSGPLSWLSFLTPKPKPSGSALTRPVVFPEADMRTLNILNNTLIKTGAVKANADVVADDE